MGVTYRSTNLAMGYMGQQIWQRPYSYVDLNPWYRALHQITGDMALGFNKAAPADLERWANVMREIADQMDAYNRRYAVEHITQS